MCMLVAGWLDGTLHAAYMAQRACSAGGTVTVTCALLIHTLDCTAPSTFHCASIFETFEELQMSKVDYLTGLDATYQRSMTCL